MSRKYTPDETQDFYEGDEDDEPEITHERRMEILHVLSSSVCESCGNPKSPRKSHCRACYFALPPRMRSALYRSFGHGYEEAYEASLGFLKDLKQPA